MLLSRNFCGIKKDYRRNMKNWIYLFISKSIIFLYEKQLIILTIKILNNSRNVQDLPIMKL